MIKPLSHYFVQYVEEVNVFFVSRFFSHNFAGYALSKMQKKDTDQTFFVGPCLVF